MAPFIVQFNIPPFDAMRAQVEHLGGVVYGSLPASALIVDLDPRTLDAVRALPGVRWVGPFEPAYKSEFRGYNCPKTCGRSLVRWQRLMEKSIATSYKRMPHTI